MRVNSEKKVEKCYMMRAQELVDGLYDKGYFREDLTRDAMDGVEDLIGFYLQSGAESATMMAEITSSIKRRK